MGANSNDDYWDSPGVKAAEKADNSDNAEDYFNSPEAKKAVELSATFAPKFEELWSNWALAHSHYLATRTDPAKRDQDRIQAAMDKVMEQIKVLGFYMDPMPKDYVRLANIVVDLRIDCGPWDGIRYLKKVKNPPQVSWWYGKPHWKGDNPEYAVIQQFEPHCNKWDAELVRKALNTLPKQHAG